MISRSGQLHWLAFKVQPNESPPWPFTWNSGKLSVNGSSAMFRPGMPTSVAGEVPCPPGKTKIRSRIQAKRKSVSHVGLMV
jgi:hypothetical protein